MMRLELYINPCGKIHRIYDVVIFRNEFCGR